jgi:hypothetical protein
VGVGSARSSLAREQEAPRPSPFPRN